MGKRGFICILLLSILLSGCGSSSSDNAGDANYSSANAEVKSESSLENVATSTGFSAELNSAAKPTTALADQMNITEQELQTGTISTPVVPVEQLKGFNSASTAEALNKKLIYTANLVMRIKDYSVAQSEVRDLVSLSGGYIVEFSENQSTHEVGGTFIIKVPANGFSSLLGGIEQIKHESFQQSIKGQDVSEEYVDLESRLKVKELMETQYTEFMKKATKTTELVTFANELGKIQEDIELIKGRIRYINNNVSYSTVEIRLYQQDGIVDPALVDKEQAPLFERANDALKGTINVLTLLFQWIVVILFGALPVILVGGVIWLSLWLTRRNKVKPKANHNDYQDPTEDQK
ncbi:DUF4349 domain-containing protein [Paenibacillus sp. FA6]|uniref:DUF4349 domain-containing protein n=1 Tax=Paenibacillus sp. FA6 TaxID=3413029 RepID=UPI003F659EBD